MNKLSRVSIVFILSLGCIGCDQSTKSLAKNVLQFETPKSYLNDTIRIMYTENSGAFLGVGDSLPPLLQTLFFKVMVGLVLCFLLYHLVTADGLNALSVTALTLMFAGGVGNLIDRFTNNGSVVDFLNIGIGPVRTGIFNVADIVVFIGAMLLFFASFTRNGEKSTEPNSKT